MEDTLFAVPPRAVPLIATVTVPVPVEDWVTTLEAQLEASLEMGKLNANEIEVVEMAEEVNLGFDTFEYLPLDFDPYAGANLSDIDFEIFEEEEIVELGFETAAYLPNNFDAYAL